MSYEYFQLVVLILLSPVEVRECQIGIIERVAGWYLPDDIVDTISRVNF